MNVAVGVGGVALPLLRSVVFSYHASCFLTTRRLFLPRVVGYCFASVSDTYGKFTTQKRNRAAVINVGVGVGGVALPQLGSVVFSYHASRFLPRVVLLITRCWLVIASRVSQTHVGIYNTETQCRYVTFAQR